MDVFDYLTDVFSLRLKMSELGITDLFVFHLTDFSVRYSVNNVSIYTTGWQVESKYGNDLDVFVQRSDGKYTWFALQAKVMSYNGAYKDIKAKPVPNQWNLLKHHESIFNSKSFYLLYNGRPFRPTNATPSRPDCLNIPPLEEYGLGIVEPDLIGTVALSRAPSGQVYFTDFFPDNMDSIRKLICCIDQFSDNIYGYDRAAIQTGPPYNAILINGVLQQVIQDEQEPSDEIKASLLDQKGLANTRIIISK
jgi:hypothetical protein